MTNWTPPWTHEQQIILALNPKFSAFIAICCNSWIIAEVLLDDAKSAFKPNNVYSRLLLGMSTFDTLESLWNFCSTWPIPRGSPDVFGAAGTTGTCTAQGFFLQWGLTVPMYNACLSIYYLLVIKYNVTDSKLNRRYEPYMHAVAITFPLLTCIACLALKQFNNANLWCWIAPYPLDCLDSARYGAQANCTRGDNAWIYRWAFYFAPLWTCIITAITTMIMVFRAVRATDVKSLQYRKPQVKFERTASVREYSQSDRTLPPPQVQIEIDQSMVIHNTSITDGSGGGGGAASSPTNAHAGGGWDNHSVQSARFSISSHATGNTNHTSASRRSRLQSWRQSIAMSTRDHRNSNEVFQQAFWYTAAFLFTHSPSTINRALQLSIGHTFWPLAYIHSVIDPLQGCLNFLVYRRPRYLRCRRNNMTRLQSFIYALRWKPPPLQPHHGGSSGNSQEGRRRRDSNNSNNENNSNLSSRAWRRISALSFGLRSDGQFSSRDMSREMSRELSREMSGEMSRRVSQASAAESLHALKEGNEEEEEKEEIQDQKKSTHNNNDNVHHPEEGSQHEGPNNDKNSAVMDFVDEEEILLSPEDDKMAREILLRGHDALEVLASLHPPPPEDEEIMLRNQNDPESATENTSSSPIQQQQRGMAFPVWQAFADKDIQEEKTEIGAVPSCVANDNLELPHYNFNGSGQHESNTRRNSSGSPNDTTTEEFYVDLDNYDDDDDADNQAVQFLPPSSKTTKITRTALSSALVVYPDDEEEELASDDWETISA